jgi:hypothetical protein
MPCSAGLNVSPTALANGSLLQWYLFGWVEKDVLVIFRNILVQPKTHDQLHKCDLRTKNRQMLTAEYIYGTKNSERLTPVITLSEQVMPYL